MYLVLDSGAVGVLVHALVNGIVQGYLANKKTPTPLGPP